MGRPLADTVRIRYGDCIHIDRNNYNNDSNNFSRLALTSTTFRSNDFKMHDSLRDYLKNTRKRNERIFTHLHGPSSPPITERYRLPGQPAPGHPATRSRGAAPARRAGTRAAAGTTRARARAAGRSARTRACRPRAASSRAPAPRPAARARPPRGSAPASWRWRTAAARWPACRPSAASWTAWARPAAAAPPAAPPGTAGSSPSAAAARCARSCLCARRPAR